MWLCIFLSLIILCTIIINRGSGRKQWVCIVYEYEVCECYDVWVFAFSWLSHLWILSIHGITYWNNGRWCLSSIYQLIFNRRSNGIVVRSWKNVSIFRLSHCRVTIASTVHNPQSTIRTHLSILYWSPKTHLPFLSVFLTRETMVYAIFFISL